MAKLVGGVACLAALVAGIFANVDPVLCLTRAGVALVAGSVVGALLGALTGTPVAARPDAAGGVSENASADGKS